MLRRLCAWGFCVWWLGAVGSVAQAASLLRGFPVQLDGTAEITPPEVFDIDGDGRLELLVGTRLKLYAIEADGNPVAGFPLGLQKGAGLATPISVGPLGPEKLPAILFGTEDQSLVVLDGTGKAREGFPVKLTAAMAGAPSLGDLNGDGQAEIAFGTADGRIHVIAANGREIAGYPASIEAPVSTVVTVGAFRPGEAARLIFGDDKGNLHVWSAPGRELTGFPFKADFTIPAQPVLGDVDNDGRNDVIFGSKDYKIYAVGSDGKALAGFPVPTGYRIYSTCALADLDDDGAVDILATSGDGKLYALKGNGKSLPGFPVSAGRRLRASPVVGDLDHDGRPEIAIGSDQNRLTVFRNNGKVYPGFPRRLDDRVEVAPLLADLNGDGLVEVFGQSRSGTLVAFTMIKKSGKPGVLAWPAEGRDSARSGRTYPNPARYVDLAISPDSPTTTRSLKLSYRFFDLDGDPEPNTLIRWYRNGKHVPDFDGKRELPSSATHKKERWNFVLQARADEPTFESPRVQVVNTPPTAPRIAILPEPTRTGDDLRLKFLNESEDLDADKVHYRITWLRDRKQLKGLSGKSVPAKLTASGQHWTAVVVPTDGEAVGDAARVSTVVVNTAPTAARVRLKPNKPTVTQEVRAVIEKPGTDPDNDPVSYLYLWQVDGQSLNLPVESPVLPAGLVAKHHKIQLELTSFDGKEPGQKSTAQAEVQDSDPSSPSIRILPASPGTLDDLAIDIEKPSTDPDHDRIAYRVRWTRSGVSYKGDYAKAIRLPASETRKGQKWTALVTPDDGEGRGKPARAEATVTNSPPIPPGLRAKNPRAKTTEDLVLEVGKPATDPDGDPITLEVIWSRGDQELARGRNLFVLPAVKTRKNQVYRARVIPSDGSSNGEPVERWFEVENTRPTGCKVAIRPDAPGSGADLTAEIVQGSTDADGDRIQMRYRWSRDGRSIENDSKKPERIKGDRVSRGQLWRVFATPFDGQDSGPSCSASQMIVNGAPSAPVVSLRPAEPTARDSLVCQLSSPSRDPDGDVVRLEYTWTLDGKPFPTGDQTARIPAGVLRKGQIWQVQVVASDGDLSSKPVTAKVQVVNTPPGAPRIAIRPEKPLSSDELNCRFTGPTPEADGDTVRYEFEWFQLKDPEGQPRGKPVCREPRLPAGRTRKGQTWLCRVRASDGQARGEPASARVQVSNAAPGPPVVKLEPSNPTARESLQCIIEKAAQDPDGDRVGYRFRWTKDGVVQSFAPGTDRVPARLTSENDIWQCSVVATDGKLDSRPAETREVVIRRPK